MLPLVGRIYDCALQNSGWSAALGHLAQAIDAAIVQLGYGDPRTGETFNGEHSPWDPEKIRHLNTLGMNATPTTRHVIAGPGDQPFSCAEIEGEDAWRGSFLYRDWFAPQELADLYLTKFALTEGRVGGLLVMTSARHARLIDAERALITAISPHIRRAVMVGDLLREANAETRLYRDALDSLNTPVVLARPDASIAHANPAAEQLLSCEHALRLRSKRLGAAYAPATPALQDAIARTAAGDAEMGDRGIGIPVDAGSDRPGIAYVLPVAKNDVRGSSMNASAAVFISTAAHMTPPPEDALSTLFGLSRAEARVMSRMGTGATQAQASEELGIAVNTLKAQLRSIYAKTGTTRQADLVRLVSDLSRR